MSKTEAGANACRNQWLRTKRLSKNYQQQSSYTELADGLNYHDEAGQWQRTRPEFIQAPDGFAALFGPHKVRLPININQAEGVQYQAGPLTLKSAPLALGYYDPESGKSVILATVWDAAGQLTSSNVVTYFDSFRELHASIRYTYSYGEFHQDIVLHEAPAAPGDFGLSDSTRLTVLTEFAENTPMPQKQLRVIRAETDPLRRAERIGLPWDASVARLITINGCQRLL